ncbi:von willebrand factor type A domain-containing protein [Gottschalkia purinilytica]|uniref:von willebrand factor type A domain-containing protein n=1 Tax=Gottschalkia purinilytica TaxID=1503 RepID=A0A0L0WF87_GOTPU|nr:VWA domain-containing protein [Gottschalkia purinilytica]KNF10096.1 von willebrand factor type A domain-containing protein [Gottschalkia purinilytica]
MDNLLFNNDLDVNNLLGSEDKSKNSLEYFELDLDIYDNIFKNSPRIRENLENYKEVITTFEKLNEDIYLALFKANPVIKEIEEISTEYRLNNVMIRNLFKIDEFKLLRNSCSLNFFSSILGTDLLGQEIVNNYEKLSESNKELKKQLKKYDKDFKEYVEIKKTLEEFHTSHIQTENNSLEEIENAKSLLKTIEVKIQKDVENIEKILIDDNLFYKSVSFAYKEFLSISNTIKSWGLDDGKLTPTSYEEKIGVSLKLKSLKKVREISEMAGRFKSSASKLQKRKTKEEGQEICGVQMGSEIHKVLPSEKILLAKETTKKSFYKKYIQRELLAYKYKNNKDKSKGPIICCVDTSGSMEGDLEVWSKSVAIALLDIAIKQKRDFVSILFSNKVYKTIEFNKNKMEPSKLYELATFFYGSGTNFVEPLTESINLINSAKYKYSDIIFITDGEAPLDEEFIEEFNLVKEKKQFRMITVNVSDKVEEALNEINDTQILLRDLTEETIEETNETLFTI